MSGARLRNTEHVSLLRRHENMPIITILVLFVIAVVAVQLITSAAAGEVRFPVFISAVNWFNIMQQVAVVGVMAMGMTVIMISGGIDLSVGMMVSMIGIFVAVSVTKYDMLPALAVMIGIGLAVGSEAGMGLIISRTKVEPFIVTLGGMIMFKGIALLLCQSREVTMSGELDFIKTNLIEGATDADGYRLVFPVFVLIFIIVTVIMWLLMKYTKYGREVYAVGSNPNAAYLAGINVRRLKLVSYALNGLLVGIAAILMLARMNVGIITLGQNLEIDVIAATVIGGVAMSGGKGNIWGTFIGVILLGGITNAMNILKLGSEWQFVVKGAIIIVAVTASYLSETYASNASLKKRISVSALIDRK